MIDCYALLIETIAQLDRASVCGTEGRRFESSWSRTLWRDVRVVEGAGLEIRCSALHYRGFESLSLRNHMHLERCPSGRRCTIGSRVWSKAIGGSNPPLSVQQQILGYVRRPTPSGQECSSGKRNVYETRSICCCFFFGIVRFHDTNPISPYLFSVTLSLLYLSSFRRCHNKI